MALIRCKECDRQISEHAVSCPGCGNPNTLINLTEEEKTKEVKREQDEQQYSVILTLIVILVVLFGGCYLLVYLGNAFKTNNLMKAMGVDTSNNTVTIKSKDENELNAWKNDVMDYLGFEYIEE